MNRLSVGTSEGVDAVEERGAIPGIARAYSIVHLRCDWIGGVPNRSKYLDGRTIDRPTIENAVIAQNYTIQSI